MRLRSLTILQLHCRLFSAIPTCFSSAGPPSCGWSPQRAVKRGSACCLETRPSQYSEPGQSWGNATGRQGCLLWQLWAKMEKTLLALQILKPFQVLFLLLLFWGDGVLCFNYKKKKKKRASVSWHANISKEDVRHHLRLRVFIRPLSCLKWWISSDQNRPFQHIFVLT